MHNKTKMHLNHLVGLAAVRSKALALLLLIHYVMFLPFLLVFCFWSWFCGASLRVLSSFAIIFKRKREMVALLKMFSGVSWL